MFRGAKCSEEKTTRKISRKKSEIDLCVLSEKDLTKLYKVM